MGIEGSIVLQPNALSLAAQLWLVLLGWQEAEVLPPPLLLASPSRRLTLLESISVQCMGPEGGGRGIIPGQFACNPSGTGKCPGDTWHSVKIQGQEPRLRFPIPGMETKPRKVG